MMFQGIKNRAPRLVSKSLLLASCIVCFGLSACKTTPDEFGGGDPVKPLSEKEKILISARNAAIEGRYQTIERGALTVAETAYRESPQDPIAAVSYARLLRQINMTDQAEMVLKPFAFDPNKKNESVLLEYTKIKLSKGDVQTAQLMAQEALEMNDQSAAAQMLLGVSVDAQGHHQAAENHFRQALEKAGADIALQNAIRNNLALSLLAQKKDDEAARLLKGLVPAASDIESSRTIEANKALVDKL